MKAPGARDSSVIRVLSPRIAPPPRFEAGSTASTAMRVPAREAVEAEALDKGRFAGAGRPGNAEPGRRAGLRQQRLDQPLGLGAMVGAGRFDQRHRPRQRPPVAGAEGGG